MRKCLLQFACNIKPFFFSVKNKKTILKCSQLKFLPVPNIDLIFISVTRGFVKEEYLVIILDNFSCFSIKNICCGYALEVPCLGISNEYPQYLFFYGELEKIIPEL